MTKTVPVIAGATLALSGCGGSSSHPATAFTPLPPTTAASAPATTSTTPAAPRAHKHASRPARKKPTTKHAAAHHSHPRTTPASSPHKTSTQPKATISYSVSFALHAGGSAEFTACGERRHYRTYASGSTIKFSGTVRPIASGTWKVKLKIKMCRGGSFVDYLKFDASEDRHHGTFSGTFRAPAPGDYEARAEFYLADVKTARSANVHLATL